MKIRTTQKLLSMLLTAALVLNLGLTPVFATEGTTPPSSSGTTVSEPVTLDISGADKYVNITANGYKVGGGEEITYTGDYIITGSATSTNASRNHVMVSGGAHDITLKGASIDLSKGGRCAFVVEGNSTVNLTLEGDNVLQSGVNRAGLEVNVGNTLTVTSASTGSLDATGGEYGAGIGGGRNGAGGAITINGGRVTATGGNYGAGIGGGHNGAGGAITINGGSVTASGAAGIGSGNGGMGETIAIAGGRVIATGSDSGAGIGGGGDDRESGAISITNNAVVYATAGEKAKNHIGNGGASVGGDVTRTNGFIFEGVNGKVYGDVTLQENITIAAGQILTVPKDTTLTIAEGHTLENNGIIRKIGTIIGEVTGTDPIVPEKTITLDISTAAQSLEINAIGYKHGGATVETPFEGDYIITTTTRDANVPTGTVKVSGGEQRITLKDASITPAEIPFKVWGKSTVVALTLEGVNVLETSDSTGKGLEVRDSTLTITEASTGSLAVRGKDREGLSNITINGGTVTATAGSQKAGITNTIINGGTVTANGGNVAAGIGTGVTVGGNAVVYANKGERATEHIDSGTVKTNCILFGGNTGTVYDSVTLQQNLTITAEQILYVNEGTTLTIPQGVTLQNNGIIIKGGTINGAVAGNTPIIPSAVVNLDISGPDQYLEISEASYKLGSGTAVPHAGSYVIRGTTTSSNAEYHIKITGGTQDITLDGVNISRSEEYKGALAVKGNSTVKLTLLGENTLQSGNERAGVEVNSGSTLSITDKSTGSLMATGGIDAAGIGGSFKADTLVAGNIIIESGTVTAIGAGGGAGIGGARAGVANQVTIKGGTVTATGGSGVGSGKIIAGAGIGGGDSASGTVTIDGNAVVYAKGSNGAAHIGNGSGTPAQPSTITKTRGIIFEGDVGMVHGSVTLQENLTITAAQLLHVNPGTTLIIPEVITLQNNGAIINRGTITGTVGGNKPATPGEAVTLDISNPNDYIVISDVGYKVGTAPLVPHIGSYIITGTATTTGNTTYQQHLTVSGGTHAITLKNVSIQLASSSTAFVVEGSSTVDLTLEGENTLQTVGRQVGLVVGKDAALTIAGSGSLTASGMWGIGGTDCGSITINSGTITATGTSDGAGIGGAGGSITINGGTITANGAYGAGIGSSRSVAGGSITINGGTIVAKSQHSAGIGNGFGGTNTTVAIRGGMVTATATTSGGFGISGASVAFEGSPVVFAMGPRGKDHISDGAAKTGGIIFESLAGKVYGTSVAPCSFVIPAQHSLTIDAGQTVTIGNGITLTNSGTINNAGTIVNSGTLKALGTQNGDGTLSGDGAVQSTLNADMVTLPQNSYSYTGIAHTPAVTVELPAIWKKTISYTTDDFSVAHNANTAVGTATVTVTPQGDNLLGAAVDKTFTIEKAPLTITGGTVTPREYDGTTAATVTALTFGGLQNGETLEITTDYTVGAPVYDSADAGTNKTVSGTASLVNSTKASNYTLTGAYTATGNITLADGPAAPTYAAMDDSTARKSFTFNTVSGYTNVTDYEWKLESDTDWTAVTTNPITVGNRAGKMQVRVKGTTNYEAGAILTHNTAFTATLEGSVSISGTATYGETLTATPTGAQGGAVLFYEWKANGEVLQAKSTSNTYKIPGTAIGKTITVEVTAESYTGLLTDITANVAKKTVTAMAGVISKVYDGTTAVETADQTLTIAKVNASDDIAVTMPNATYDNKNVGTGKTITMGDLTITGAAKDWYTVTAPSSVTGEITAKPLANSMISGINASYPYSGSAIIPAPTVTDGDPSIVATSDYTVSHEANTNVGTAKVILTGKGNYSGTVEKTFTISKATGSISITGDPAQTYDGTAASEPAVNKNSSDGAVSFEWYEGSTLLAGAPKDAGSYTVKAIMADGTNHTAATATKDFAIAKAAAPSITYPTTAGLSYGAKLSTSALTGGSTTYGSFAWEDGSIVPTVTNSGYSVKFTPSEATLKNYEEITALVQTVSVAVVKTTPVIDLKVQISGDAGSRQATLTATLTKVGDGEIPTGTVKFVNSTSGTDVDITGATAVSITDGVATYTWTGLADQAYNVNAEYSGSGNYDTATATEISFDTRKQNQQNFEIAAIGTKTYGDGVFTLTTSGGNGSGAVSFTSSDPATVSISGNTATIRKAGNVTITANKAEDDSYNEATATASLTVNKKAISFIANDMPSVVKGSPIPVFTYKPVTLATGDRITTEPTLTTAALDTNTLGKFAITISGAEITNADSYTITYVNGEMTVVEQLYTVTVTDGTGGGQYSEGQTVSITANDRSGYTFTSWSSSDGVTFADSNAKATTFTMLGKNVTVKADYNQDSTDGGGGSVTPAPSPKPETPTTAESNVNSKTDKDGNATAVVADKDITNAIDKAQKEAKKNGTEANGIAITLNVKMDKNATTLGVTLTQKSIAELIAAKVTQLTVNNGLSTITLDLAALKVLAGGDVILTVSKMDVKTLSAEAQNAIAGRPVFRFGATVGGKAVTDFKDGRVGLQMPYIRSTSEQVGNLCAVYVDGNGKVNWLENSSYDPITGMMLASTSHFSIYGVGYKQSTPKFTDVGTHWAKSDIDFVVARGLLTGTSDTTFAPDQSMTRGMFVTALGRLAEVDTKQFSTTKFTDVAATAYYAPYVAWANANNIVNGTSDTTFDPDKAITRQEMAVMLVNYSKSIGYKLPSVHAEVSFTDASSIASWAKDAVRQMQMAGILMGKSGNRFDPTATATRAEVSAMLRRFVELVASTETAEVGE